ncbi:sugar phosphate isomerase/epimerase family protein [Paenibacillus sp. GD4]|jgi:sugar phosphate isomerase/epimerase|uniref:sugar phosphate isomerase/epimerase family protein n=1 Tax=Paenibacillus sp. GD4 TaxID=3068890 RepID=UPI00279684EB|nr:sugar phosphate isomerase/epimerase family protein [Paenibacillus sp. GD4]MDQ1910603.1 sugar phosphate isomerase/epimerase family protein [Paenibacillus sp. GD4]
MKLSVFTVVTPDFTPEELAAAAKEAGLDGIEWRFKEVPEEAKGEKPSFWRNNLCSIDPKASDEEIARFDRAAKENGLESLSVTPYLTAGDLEATERVLQVAQKLGAKMIRVGVPGYNRSKNYNELFDVAVRYLEGVEPLAKKYGVKCLVETHHHTITPSAGLAHRLVSKFDPNHIGVLFDPGNMIHEGYENFRMGLELLGPYLAHVHMKNTGWKKTELRADGSQAWTSYWEPNLEGVVDWKQVIEDLKSVGYDGYIGVEDFSGKYGSKELLVQFAKEVRALLA